MRAEVSQHRAVDVDFGLERRAEARPPALRLAVGVDEDVGLHRREAFFAYLATDSLHTVEIGDRRLEPVGMVDAPGRAVRPVHPDTVAHLAAEQVVAGHAERLGLDVKQRVLDRADRQRHHAAGGGPRRGKQLRVDPLMLVSVLADHARRKPLDRSRHAGRAKTFVVLAPADDTVLGHDLDEVVVAPAGVAGERFDASDLGGLFHVSCPGACCCG